MAETIRQNLRMRWGEEPAWLVTVTDDGAVVDITGGTMRFTAKISDRDPDSAAVFSKTTGDGIILTEPTLGEATVTLVDTDTTGLAPGRRHLLRYDCWLTLSGQSVVVAYGTLLVEPAVSRAV
jgi:hypothetical protein